MVEMGGLEPPTPYMRSNKSGLTNPCSIRVSRPLSRLLPIVLPTKHPLRRPARTLGIFTLTAPRHSADRRSTYLALRAPPSNDETDDGPANNT